MVSIHRCENYTDDALQAAFDRALEDIGGWEPYLQPGEKVLLKVNLVAARDPSLAATTHPEFVRVLAKSLIDYGCTVTIGDSPGGVFNAARLTKVYRVTGMEKVAEETGAQLSLNTNVVEVENPNGRFLKKLTLTSMVMEADKVISVCKLKTHGMMTYTGAVKNLFGAVPGTVKAEYHMRMPEWSDFAEALLDIFEATHPVLSFMDAVIGMEGNGPTNGTPRKIGAILASPDAAGLDMAACHIIGLEPALVPLLERAQHRGWIPEHFEDLILAGDPIEDFYLDDYQIPDHIESNAIDSWIPKGLRTGVAKILRPKVHFDPNRCVGCGECAANCPAKVITMKNHRPTVNYHRCIRCYCCQELCPRNAVSVRQSLAFRIANRM
jgi:uncharacterized protein (DUF362 family)/Pyruvate/2-oxoacid:ferredoxin oxidoreductase delta subunit